MWKFFKGYIPRFFQFTPPQNIPSFSLGILKYLLVKETTAVSATETSGKKKIECKPAHLIY